MMDINLNTESVIHVFDNKDLAENLGAQFVDYPIQLLETSDFDEALELLSELKNKVRLIIVSVEKFSNHSIEFFKQLKVYGTIPIITLTDTSNSENVKNLLRYGFNDYISNQQEIAKIGSDIKELLSNRNVKPVNPDYIKVAVIDDDNLQLKIIQTLFMGRGVNNIETFLSAEEFLSDPAPFDVFLVDVVLNKMSGLQLVAKLRQMYAAALIFVISSVDDVRLIASAFNNGADDFLKKPIEREIFISKIFNKLKN